MMLFKDLSRENLAAVMRSHGWAYLAPMESADNGFRYPLLLASGTPVTLRVAMTRNGVRVGADKPLSPAQRKELRAVAGHMLSLDFPLPEFQEICRRKRAKRLLRLANDGWGRMLRSPTWWEDAVKTLCTTNASWGYTEKMCLSLCSKLGRTTDSGGRTFPSPEAVLDCGERFLRRKVGMGYRSKSLGLLAERALTGEVIWLLDRSARPDAADAEKEIRSWHGFGVYATRHLLVLMGFHRYLPIDREVGSHLGIRKPGDRASKLDSDHFEDWGEFRFTAYKLDRVVRRVNWIGD